MAEETGFPISRIVDILSEAEMAAFWEIGITGQSGTARRGDTADGEELLLHNKEPGPANAERIGVESIWKAG